MLHKNDKKHYKKLSCGKKKLCITYINSFMASTVLFSI